MALWKPDPTFYPSPREAAAAPPEKLAYVAAFARPANAPDAIAVVDVDPGSQRYGSVVGFTELPHAGDELHHFGWNACSSALCPYAPHPHVERRYLVVPGLRSSRLYVLDTKDDPTAPTVVKVLQPEELSKRAGYSRPHTVHCGPEGIYVPVWVAGTVPMALEALPCSTTPHLRCSAASRLTGAISTSRMTSGGTSPTTSSLRRNGQPRR